MAEGLDINKAEFRKLSSKEQNTIIFENVLDVKKSVSGVKWQVRLQWGAIVILFTAVSIIVNSLV